jgi:hypothetical protein
MQVKALKLLYGVLVGAQLFWFVRIFFWHPNIEDSYHYSIAVAGYALFGFLASGAVLLLTLRTRKRLYVRKVILIAIIAAIPIWGLLFLLASVAV